MPINEYILKIVRSSRPFKILCQSKDINGEKAKTNRQMARVVS